MKLFALLLHAVLNIHILYAAKSIKFKPVKELNGIKINAITLDTNKEILTFGYKQRVHELVDEDTRILTFGYNSSTPEQETRILTLRHNQTTTEKTSKILSFITSGHFQCAADILDLSYDNVTVIQCNDHDDGSLEGYDINLRGDNITQLLKNPTVTNKLTNTKTATNGNEDNIISAG
eukprot:182665_1